jgi:hypothetical protein
MKDSRTNKGVRISGTPGKLSESQRIENALDRSQKFREVLSGERTLTRGKAIQTEWGSRVRIVPGERIPK